MGNEVDITKWKRVGLYDGENPSSQGSNQAEIDKLTNSIFEAKTQKETATTDVSNAQLEAKEASEQRNSAIDQTTSALSSLQSELGAAAQNVAACSAALSSITIPELVPTTTKIDETTGKEVTVPGNEAEVAAALQAQAQAAAELAAAQAQMQEVQALCEETSAALQEEQAALQDVQSENDTKLQELNDSIDEFNTVIQDLQTQLDELKQQAQEQLKDYEITQGVDENGEMYYNAKKDEISANGYGARFETGENGSILTNGNYSQLDLDENGNLISYNQPIEVKEDANGNKTYVVKDHEGNEKVIARSGTEAAEALIHASSQLFNARLIDGAYRINDDLIGNEEWRVDMDVNGDGVVDEDESLNLADAIAASFDSELDLYIEKAVQDIIKDTGCYNFRELFGREDCDALVRLAQMGIRADGVGDADNWQNRTYSFSLMEMPDDPELAALRQKPLSELTQEERQKLLDAVRDPEAKVLSDEAGNKGSVIFADCLVPDGMAQGAEMNLSSILDVMGYDCISKADFIGKEDEYFALMDEIGTLLNEGYYQGGNATFADMYTENTLNIADAVRAVYKINGNAPGQWGKAVTFEENMERIKKFGLGSIGGNATPTGSLGAQQAIGELNEDMKKLLEEEKQEAQKAQQQRDSAKAAANSFKQEVKKQVAQYQSQYEVNPEGKELQNIISSAASKTGYKVSSDYNSVASIDDNAYKRMILER